MESFGNFVESFCLELKLHNEKTCLKITYPLRELSLALFDYLSVVEGIRKSRLGQGEKIKLIILNRQHKNTLFFRIYEHPN